VSKARALAERIREHNLSLVSAGIAFYAFLAFVPSVIIIVSVYGRVAGPRDIRQQVHNFAGALPDEVERFIQSQITAVARADVTGVSLTLVVAFLIALWSASGGIAALLAGVRVALGLREPEGYLKKRLKALGLTIGAVLLLTVIVFLVAPLPTLIADAGFGTESRIVLNVLRWPVLLFLMAVSFGVVYRLAGDRSRHKFLGVATPGAFSGALLALVASALFAVYTANFSSYTRRYGTLASIVVVLFWLYLNAYAVLLGAEVDGLSAQRGDRGDDQPREPPSRTEAAQASTSVST
jgi:membrane protein